MNLGHSTAAKWELKMCKDQRNVLRYPVPSSRRTAPRGREKWLTAWLTVYSRQYMYSVYLRKLYISIIILLMKVNYGRFRILWWKCTNLFPLLFLYRFLVISGLITSKNHVFFCVKLCVLQCHWLATSISVNILWLTGKVHQSESKHTIILPIIH